MIVRAGDDHFDKLMSLHISEKGDTLTYMGYVWRVYNDDDGKYFVAQSQGTGLDGNYGSMSLRQAGTRPVNR